jgi:AraC-like DNA-binding protein
MPRRRGKMRAAAKADELFDKMLRELGARRAADDVLHATAGTAQRPTELPPPFRRWDVHGCYELALVSKGRARVGTPTDVFELTPARLLLIDPGVEHDESPAEQPVPYEMFWCHIQDTVARLYHTAYSPPKMWQAGPSLELGGRTGLENIVTAVARELDNRDWGWLRSARALLVYLTAILVRRLRRGSILRLRASESPTISADPRTWRVIQAALQFCDANFRQPIRLAEVAAAVGYSPTHLSRLISTHLGHSLSDHIRSLRVTAGKQLLEASDLSISEIARSLGYRDPSYFSHAFKRATKLSPRTYRQRMGRP